MSQRNYSLKVQTSCFAVQLQPFPLSPSAGLRRLHLHLLRPGDGGEDGGPGHLRPPLLPGRHLEPPGLLHRHGRVSDRPGSFAVVDCFVCLFVGSVVSFGVKKDYPFSSLWIFTIAPPPPPFFLFSHRKLSCWATCERDLNSHESLLLWKMHRFIHMTASCLRAEWKQVHRCFAYHINKERDLIIMPGIHRTKSGVSRSAGREKEKTIPEAAIWTAE